MERFDRLRHANGGTPTAELRDKMQRHAGGRGGVPHREIAGARAASASDEIWGGWPTSRSPTAR
jgi:succinate dehydrogenase / fumarate reductase, flavoprotein subunit